ncbi:MAG: SMI1/KNR4 family protein [Novosphingobium sp.]
MKIGLHNESRASKQDIASLEMVIGQKLDKEFLEFIANHNGATPDANSYPVDGLHHMGSIRKFIPIEKIPQELRIIEDSQVGNLEFSYPIALDDCGNYTILSQGKDGGIFFWDHEIDKISKLSDRFNEFLEMVEPFELSNDINESCRSADIWVDPNFKPDFS